VPDLLFLADMNISPITLRELKKHGWDIVRVSEVLNANAKDEEILRYARVINVKYLSPSATIRIPVPP